MRLIGFARPLRRYAIPYFIFAVLHALFNTFNYAMIVPILNTMFGEDNNAEKVYELTLTEEEQESLAVKGQVAELDGLDSLAKNTEALALAACEKGDESVAVEGGEWATTVTEIETEGEDGIVEKGFAVTASAPSKFVLNSKVPKEELKGQIVAEYELPDTVINVRKGFVPTHERPNWSLKGEELQKWLYYIYTWAFDAESASDWDPGNVMIMLAVILIVMNLCSNLFRFFGGYTVERMRIETIQRMRDAMFDSVVGKDVGFFSDQRKGDIMSRITSDVGAVQYCITNTLQVVLHEPLMIVGYLVLMFSISWKLAIFAILFLPLVGVIIGSIVKKLRHPASQSMQRTGEMISVLDESLGGIKIIKTYTATEYIKKKFHALNQSISDILYWMARRQLLASPMSEFLGISAVAVILIYGGSLVESGELSGAGFIAFIAAFSQITRPVRALLDQFSSVNQGVAAGERLFEVLDAETEIKDAPDAKDFEGFKDKIEFRDVHFSYDDTREIIHGVSFEVRKGETIALVGPSGGGKSTLSELLERFYDVDSGDILFDGVSIRDYKQDSLRGAMSLVSQDTVLFNDSIRNNIALGNRNATDEEIIEACKVANAHNFIMESPEGYETNIGDRGSKLSGGQRQRLSIARAVLKNPEILILDEATSALDTESEKLVQDALNKLLKGRTSVVIAHRLSTIMNADRIFVIDEGRIVEQGKHDELIAKGGVYAKLVELQNVK